MNGLPGVAALLLSFAMLLSGRPFPFMYAAQCVVIAVGAVVTVSAADPWPLGAALVLLIQAALVPRLLRDDPRPAPAPLPALGGGVVLAVLAASVSLADGFASPLAMVLLGLLGAALAADGAGMRFGVLMLLNGAAAAVCVVPGSVFPVLVLAALASVVASQGLPRWGALR